MSAPSLTPPADAELPVRPPGAPPPGTDLAAHYRHCYACGDAAGGMRMRIVAGEGLTVLAQFTVGSDHQGAPGLAHGGLLAAAFDEALGAVCALLCEPAVTGRLDTSFHRPVPAGSTLHIAARIDARSGRKVYVSATGHLDAPDGRVAGRARAIYLLVRLEHFARHGRAAEIEAAVRDPQLRGNPHLEF